MITATIITLVLLCIPVVREVFVSLVALAFSFSFLVLGAGVLFIIVSSMVG